MTLATLPDYIVRHGQPDDDDQVETLLADASSFVRLYAGHLSRVEDDHVVLDGDGTRRIFLPEIPVVEVASVAVGGLALDAAAWQAWEWGGLDRLDGDVWPAAPGAVEVIYTHGESQVPGWVVNLVCAAVQRSLRPQAAQGIQSETTGSQNVQYVTTAAGVNLWLTEAEITRLTALRGAALA